jgi:hypothetical protein
VPRSSDCARAFGRGPPTRAPETPVGARASPATLPRPRLANSSRQGATRTYRRRGR